MKHLNRKVFLWLLALVVIGIGYTYHWPTGELATLQENINNQIENTYNDNQLGQVDFKTTSYPFQSFA